MLIAAARALADVVTPDELNAAYIVPSVFHPDVATAVAAAVSKAVRDSRQLGGRRPGGRAGVTGPACRGGRWLVLAVAVAVNLALLYWPRAPGRARRRPRLDKVVHVATFASVAWAGLRAGLPARWWLPLLGRARRAQRGRAARAAARAAAATRPTSWPTCRRRSACSPVVRSGASIMGG